MSDVAMTFTVENPDAIRATLSMTMTISEWRALREQLTGAYPAWKLSQAINGVIALAESRFSETLEWDAR